MRIVRILFPGVGLLVFSAWCLGILNSHRRFFLSYSAGVIWNAAMIAAMLGWGGRAAQDRLAIILAWGSVAGSFLQVGVQLPVVLRLLGGLRLCLGRWTGDVKTVVVNFFPVFLGRGVVQISAYVDGFIASFLPTAAVSGLASAQTSLHAPRQFVRDVGFRCRVAANVGRGRQRVGGRRSPSRAPRCGAAPNRISRGAVGGCVSDFGGRDCRRDLSYGALQSGRRDFTSGAFSPEPRWVSSLPRLDGCTHPRITRCATPRTPLRFAIVRVALTSILGYLCALPLPRHFGIDPRWGVAGLTISAGVASWVEFHLLRTTLNRRIGRTGLPLRIPCETLGHGSACGWRRLGDTPLRGHHRPIPLARVCSVAVRGDLHRGDLAAGDRRIARAL